jgi:hypothetical protein
MYAYPMCACMYVYKLSGIRHVEFSRFSNVSGNTAVAVFRVSVFGGGGGGVGALIS